VELIKSPEDGGVLCIRLFALKNRGLGTTQNSKRVGAVPLPRRAWGHARYVRRGGKRSGHVRCPPPPLFYFLSLSQQPSVCQPTTQRGSRCYPARVTAQPSEGASPLASLRKRMEKLLRHCLRILGRRCLVLIDRFNGEIPSLGGAKQSLKVRDKLLDE